MCRQCSDCGIKYGQRKRTREIVAWAKKKRKHINREELLAFLLDKPYTESTTPIHKHESLAFNDMPTGHQFGDLPMSHQHMSQSGMNHFQSPTCPLGGYSSPHSLSSTPVPSPRRRTLCREDPMCNDGETFLSSNGRKRPANNSSCSSFDFDADNGPFAKRMRF